MASLYKTSVGAYSNTDLDDIFMLYTSGTKATATGYVQGASEDLRDRYQALTTGSAPASVGYTAQATDIAARFQDATVPLTTVTLTNQTENLDTTTGGKTGGIRFNADGTLDFNNNGSYVQLAPTTDWIIPNIDADSTYDVRLASYTTGTFATEAASAGTWIDLGSNQEWSRLVALNQNNIVTCVFEIRKDGGAVLDSMTFTINWNGL